MSEVTTGRTVDAAGINHPKHYNTHPSGVEVIEIARWMGFNLGSAFKYVMRRGEKIEDGVSPKQAEVKDLRKALWYVQDEMVHGIHRCEPPLSVRERMMLVRDQEPNSEVARLLVDLFRGSCGESLALFHARDSLAQLIATGEMHVRASAQKV